MEYCVCEVIAPWVQGAKGVVPTEGEDTQWSVRLVAPLLKTPKSITMDIIYTFAFYFLPYSELQ